MSEEHIETVEEQFIAPHRFSTDLAINTNTSVGRDTRASQDVMSYASLRSSEESRVIRVSRRGLLKLLC